MCDASLRRNDTDSENPYPFVVAGLNSGWFLERKSFDETLPVHPHISSHHSLQQSNSPTMKVFLNYTDNTDETLHKTLKITLPKKWKTGPTSKLLDQFVETYNSGSCGETNPLNVNDLHLAVPEDDDDDKNGADKNASLLPLPSDAITLDVIPDRSDVFVMHGPSTTLAAIRAEEEAAKAKKRAEEATMARCTHFGCKNRFPKGGPYPECSYHAAPPVFHETVKFWSCCPHKKAYDWNDFEAIPGCQKGRCTEQKEDRKQFLGGTDMRAQAAESSNLRSIDDFNKAQAAGGTDAAPVLDRLRDVLKDLGVDHELFDQVVEGMKKEFSNGSVVDPDAPVDPVLLDSVATELGKKLKASMKAIAVEQLRIK